VGTYLQDNPPRQTQFRPRRAKPTGLIVIHTAESATDTVGEDTGADAVAGFIRTRSDYGSYHVLCDSDSRLRLVPFTHAAYGDGTGSNEFAIHVSAATAAHMWPRMSKARRDGFIRQMAEGAATAARWLQKTHGITVPARRVTKAQSDQGMAGFISHGERDPGRRTDPGKDFPWEQFLAEFSRAMKPKPKPQPKPPKPQPKTAKVSVGVINVPRKVGRANWKKCWSAAAKRTGIFGINESLTPEQRDAYAALACAEQWGQYGLRQCPNPIFWRRSRWQKVTGKVHKIHDAAPGPLRARFPGYNAPRWINEVVLKDKRTGKEVAILNTHWVSEGKKVNAVWRPVVREQSKRAARNLVKAHQAVGRPVVFIGDTNIRKPFAMPKGFRWIRGEGIDKIGAAGLARHGKPWKFKAPTDHKHGIAATVEF